MKTGTKHTEATRAKLSASHKGQTPWNKGVKTGIAPANKGERSKFSRMGVYQIVAGGISYVGSSKNVLRRWNLHRHELKVKKHDNKRLQAIWDEYGPHLFSLVLLEEVALEADLLAREQHWMDNIRPSLNVVVTARSVGRPAHYWTDEQRRKCRNAKGGELDRHLSQLRRIDG